MDTPHCTGNLQYSNCKKSYAGLDINKDIDFRVYFSGQFVGAENGLFQPDTGLFSPQIFSDLRKKKNQWKIDRNRPIGRKEHTLDLYYNLQTGSRDKF